MSALSPGQLALQPMPGQFGVPNLFQQQAMQQQAALAAPAAAPGATGTTPGNPIAGLGVPGGDAIANSYAQNLAAQQSYYNNVLNQYKGILAGQQAAQAGVQAQYGQLGNQIQGELTGVDAAQREMIARNYAQQAGSAVSSLANRGLGNTTVTDSTIRGLALDRNLADVALSNQTSQLKAGYMANIGLAGLGFAGQSIAANTALQAQQAAMAYNVGRAIYPTTSDYLNMFSLANQNDQAAKNRALQLQLAYLTQGRGAGLTNFNTPNTGSSANDPNSILRPFTSGGTYRGGAGDTTGNYSSNLLPAYLFNNRLYGTAAGNAPPQNLIPGVDYTIQGDPSSYNFANDPSAGGIGGDPFGGGSDLSGGGGSGDMFGGGSGADLSGSSGADIASFM